jgi:hypothetical protein
VFIGMVHRPFSVEPANERRLTSIIQRTNQQLKNEKTIRCDFEREGNYYRDIYFVDYRNEKE